MKLLWEYSENAWVCAKWQWNARDCVTGLHDRRSRECNPVTPVECVSLSFRTHPCVLAFITHILRVNGIEMTFVWLIWYTLLYTFFKFAICFIALMNLGETCQLKRRDLVTVWRTMLLLCCYHCDWMQQHYDVTQFEYILWRHTIHEWVMNIHYKTWIAQGRFTNMILTPSKQWGGCDKRKFQVGALFVPLYRGHCAQYLK